jgi:hypothetical protein
MDRRGFLLTGVAGLLAARPGAGAAQEPGKTRRIGFISNGSRQTGQPLLDAFVAGLREHGWIEGTNVVLETRWADADLSRLPRLARELVALPVDVIVLAGTARAVRPLVSRRVIREEANRLRPDPRRRPPEIPGLRSSPPRRGPAPPRRRRRRRTRSGSGP